MDLDMRDAINDAVREQNDMLSELGGKIIWTNRDDEIALVYQFVGSNVICLRRPYKLTVISLDTIWMVIKQITIFVLRQLGYASYPAESQRQLHSVRGN